MSEQSIIVPSFQSRGDVIWTVLFSQLILYSNDVERTQNKGLPPLSVALWLSWPWMNCKVQCLGCHKLPMERSKYTLKLSSIQHCLILLEWLL